MEKILRCIKKGQKLKVVVDDEQGYVQFPNKLRGVGKIYKARVSFNGKFWKLDSPPRELNDQEKIQEQVRKDKISLKEKIRKL